MVNKLYLAVFCVVSVAIGVQAKKDADGEKPEWAKKDIRFYNDADMERLLDQWNEDDDVEDDPDDLPEHLRPQPQIDMSKIDMSNPENLLQQTKKGRTLMTFVAVSGNPTRDEAEEITKIWQTSLWNANIQAERYMVDDNRAIFMYKDGAQAWEAKNFLVEQERCTSVTIENKVYDGKGKTTAAADSSDRDEL